MNIPQLFLDRARRNPDADAFFVMDALDPAQGGAPALAHPGWRRYSYADSRAQISELAMGLVEAGVEPGDRVAILGETSHLWVAADLAVLSVGAVTVGLYPTLTGPQLAALLEHSGAKAILIDSSALLDKLQPYFDRLPALLLRFALRPGLGLPMAPRRAAPPGWLDRRVAAVPEDALATLVYTSGTTGEPKGVMLHHRHFVAVVRSSEAALPLAPGDRSVVFLPLAHSLQRFALYRGLAEGVVGYFAPSIEALPVTLETARPQVLLSVPRMLEKIKSSAEATAARRGPKAARVYAWAVDIGLQHAAFTREGRRPPLALRAQRRAAEALVFRKIKAKLGGALEMVISGGAALHPEVGAWFEAIGVPVREGWGLTETCAPATTNRRERHALGTVGPAMPGVEVRVAPDGELMVRSPGNFSGYWRDPEATAAAFDADGFFYTGDLGSMDRDGFFRITGRKKDIIVTAGGKNVAPNPIEADLLGGFIGQAVVIGDERPYLVALLTLDLEQAEAQAQGAGWPGGPEDWLSQPALRAAVAARVEATNASRAPFEQIKRWRLLARPFTVEAEEMTPSLKLRRAQIAARRAAELEQLYAPGLSAAR